MEQTGMNIFYVDESPFKAAECLVDRHVVKMILESCQLLSTAHRVLDGKEVVEVYRTSSNKSRKKKVYKLNDAREFQLYQATHVNHPSAVWVRESIENYRWLLKHTYWLLREYSYRYGKIHKCQVFMTYALKPPFSIPTIAATPMPSVMDPVYKISNDPVENYRNYYIHGKSHLHKYTKRSPPDWLTHK
jgi:hypothetical protein